MRYLEGESNLLTRRIHSGLSVLILFFIGSAIIIFLVLQAELEEVMIDMMKQRFEE